MEIYENAVRFFMENTATVLLVVAIVYFIVLAITIVRSKKTGKGFNVRLRNIIGFAVIIGLAIYCMITGRSLGEFIN